MDADRLLTFEGYSLDLANEHLLHDGDVVALTPKAFAILRRAVEDGGRVVTGPVRQALIPATTRSSTSATSPAGHRRPVTSSQGGR